MRSRRVADRERDRGRHRDHRWLAETLRAERPRSREPLDERYFDRRDLPEGRDPVIEETRVQESTVLRPHRLLRERRSETHHDAALYLRGSGRGVDDRADIVERGVPGHS